MTLEDDLEVHALQRRQRPLTAAESAELLVMLYRLVTHARHGPPDGTGHPTMLIRTTLYARASELLDTILLGAP